MGQFVQLLTFVSVWLTCIRGAFAMEPVYVRPLDRMLVSPLESAQDFYSEKRTSLRLNGDHTNPTQLVAIEFLGAMGVELEREHRNYREQIREYLNIGEREYTPCTMYGNGSLLKFLSNQRPVKRKAYDVSFVKNVSGNDTRAAELLYHLFQFYGVGMPANKYNACNMILRNAQCGNELAIGFLRDKGGSSLEPQLGALLMNPLEELIKSLRTESYQSFSTNKMMLYEDAIYYFLTPQGTINVEDKITLWDKYDYLWRKLHSFFIRHNHRIKWKNGVLNEFSEFVLMAGVATFTGLYFHANQEGRGGPVDGSNYSPATGGLPPLIYAFKKTGELLYFCVTRYKCCVRRKGLGCCKFWKKCRGIRPRSKSLFSRPEGTLERDAQMMALYLTLKFNRKFLDERIKFEKRIFRVLRREFEYIIKSDRQMGDRTPHRYVPLFSSVGNDAQTHRALSSYIEGEEFKDSYV